MPRWLMAIIATALVLGTLVGSSQDTAEAIDPADTDTVYIADGTNFADALMGATIASLNTSPMLGVAGTDGGDVIPGDTVDELDRLTNDKGDPLDTIYIFGGTSAVSADVANQLGQWADDVQRIEGDSRWGTYEAISQMLPSAVDEAVHAQEADHATEADNADTLDGLDSDAFPRNWTASDTATLTIPAETGDSPTPGFVTPVAVDVGIPSSGVLVIDGTAILRNRAEDPVQITETSFTGASTDLAPDTDSHGSTDTVSFTGAIEVDDGDDGPIGFQLRGIDLAPEPAPGNAEEIDVTAIINVTFYADSQGEIQ